MDKHIYKPRKQYLIKNRKRFIISITLLCLSFIFILSVILDNNYARGEKETIPYITVLIKEGETLWSLAKKYKPKKVDIRQYIKEIREFNSLESANIISGDYIQMPLS